jgi:hypothetical protein
MTVTDEAEAVAATTNVEVDEAVVAVLDTKDVMVAGGRETAVAVDVDMEEEMDLEEEMEMEIAPMTMILCTWMTVHLSHSLLHSVKHTAWDEKLWKDDHKVETPTKTMDILGGKSMLNVAQKIRLC